MENSLSRSFKSTRYYCMANQTYYAVIFTSILNIDIEGYHEMADQMETLASKQDGFISFETARGELGISISYWESLESIRNWKSQSDHLLAQSIGKDKWYQYYKVRICRVEREYEYGEIFYSS
jgi:heme-degrading monooxygenase HmoA